MAPELLVLALDGPSRAHLARALEQHDRWCRTNGLPVPATLVRLAGACAVRNGQNRPDRGDEDLGGEHGPMALAFKYDEAGRLLGVSERTIRRLVSSRELAAIDVAGARRIARDDLVAYANRQRQPQEEPA